jgi:competence protein ComEC
VSVWRNIPFLRINIFFILGILVAISMPSSLSINRHYIIWAIVVQILIVLVMTWFVPFQYNIYGGILIVVNLSVAGCFSFLYNKSNISASHFGHFLKEINAYEASITSVPNIKDDSIEATLSISTIKVGAIWKRAMGKVRIVVKGPLCSLEYGDVMLVRGQPKEVNSPLNPCELDYKSILGNKDIYHSHFIEGHQIILTGQKKGNYVKKLAISFKKRLYKVIDQNVQGRLERALLKSFILGDRSALSKDEIDNYVKTGTIHVLAISGLHIGILFVFINAVLRRLYLINKSEAAIYLISIILLWAYALIVGLPESAVRATTMFSLFCISKMLKREYVVHNSLLISIFLLLLCDPLMIKSPGFQLSYLAVSGLVYIAPIVNRFLFFSIKVNSYLSQVACFSISAQLAVLPVILYYFHDYSTYFLLANFIVIPLMSVVAYLTFSLLIMNKIFVISKVLGLLLSKMLYLTHEVLGHIKSLPYNSIQHIYISGYMVIMLYVLIIIALIGIYKRKFTYVVSLYFLLCVCYIAIVFGHATQTGVIFYSIPRCTAYSIIRGNESVIYVNGVSPQKMEYAIMPSQHSLNITSTVASVNTIAPCHSDIIRRIKDLSVLYFCGKKFLILTDTNSDPQFCLRTTYNDKKIAMDYLFIDSDKYSFAELSKIFEIKKIIVGTRVSSKKLLQIEEQAAYRNIPLHSLARQGAYVLFF